MHTIVATDREHLDDLIWQRMSRLGPSADLNDIDVSNIKNFASLFADNDFNGQISQWNTARATNMNGMFCRSAFQGDISSWNVANVTSMHQMFAASTFNGDISGWDVANVLDLRCMFEEGVYAGDLSTWSLHSETSTWRMLAVQKDWVAPVPYRLPVIPSKESMLAVFGMNKERYQTWRCHAPRGVNHWEEMIKEVVWKEDIKTANGYAVPIDWPHQDMLDQWLAVRSVHAGLGLSLRESAIAMVQLRTTHASGITDMVLPCLDTEQDMHA